MEGSIEPERYQEENTRNFMMSEKSHLSKKTKTCQRKYWRWSMHDFVHFGWKDE